MELQYFCSVCKELFEIPPEMKKKLLNSEETLELPQHCGKQMAVKIAKKIPKISEIVEEKKFEEIDVPSAEILMGFQSTDDTKAEYLEVISVGIDIGLHMRWIRCVIIRANRYVSLCYMCTGAEPEQAEHQ